MHMILDSNHVAPTCDMLNMLKTRILNTLCHEGQLVTTLQRCFQLSVGTQIQFNFMDVQIFLHPACWQNAIPSCQSSKNVVSVWSI